MIFIIKDEHNEGRDRVRYRFDPIIALCSQNVPSFDWQTIAKHVMRVHMNRQDESAEAQGEIDIDKMKRYIAYCKS